MTDDELTDDELELGRLRERIGQALDELGVPGPGYPAPVVNAIELLQGET